MAGAGPCRGPGSHVLAARGRTEGRAAGPRRSRRWGPGRVCSARAGRGALQEPGCRGRAWAPTGAGGHLVLVGQLRTRQVCEAAPFVRLEEVKRRETSHTAREGRVALLDDHSTPGDAHSPSPPCHPTGGSRRLSSWSPLCFLETPGAGRPQGHSRPGLLWESLRPAGGWGSHRGGQHPQTPCRPTLPRPRAFCART